MDYRQEIQNEILRVDKIVQEMSVGRYVKILPKPEPRRLGRKRVWRQRYEREEYKDMTEEEMSRIDPERMRACLASMESRWGDDRCDFYTTRPPFLSEIVQMSQHGCSICQVPFDFSVGTKDQKNWKGLSVDRIDTGLGPNGSGRLILLDSPDRLGYHYHWENVPGYLDNMQPLCRGCNTIKSKFEDKGNVMMALMTKYPVDMAKYYQDRADGKDVYRDAANGYRTAFARYIYGRPVPDCELDGPGPCDICGGISSEKIYLESSKRWIRACREHNYPQVSALNDFERMFFGHMVYDRPMNKDILLGILHTRPGVGQRDTLGTMRQVVEMILETEDSDSEDSDVE